MYSWLIIRLFNDVDVLFSEMLQQQKSTSFLVGCLVLFSFCVKFLAEFGYHCLSDSVGCLHVCDVDVLWLYT